MHPTITIFIIMLLHWEIQKADYSPTLYTRMEEITEVRQIMAITGLRTALKINSPDSPGEGMGTPSIFTGTLMQIMKQLPAESL